MYLNILILLECTQSDDNLFHLFTVLWENDYFLTSNLLCPFTSVKLCPLVRLPALILKKKLYWSLYSHDIQYLKNFSVAEWLRAWDTLTMFEATVCGRS